MRLTRLSRSEPDGRANYPEARVGVRPLQARSNDQQPQQQTTATADVTEPVGAAQSQSQLWHEHNQIIDDGISRRPDVVVGQSHGQPPPSSNMMATSQLDAANAMDYGVKFIGGLDAMPGTVARVQPTAATTATVTTGGDPLQPLESQHQLQSSYYPIAPEHPTTPTVVGHPPSNFYTAEKPRQQVEAGRQEEDHDEADCHPFWLSWRDIFLGIWMITTGVLKIPLVIGDGFAKAMHHTPLLYGDKTVRKWPQLTGFPHGCVASFQALWFGIYDGATDWVILPYKAVRDGGGVQGGLKGFLQGLANAVFKPLAGCTAFIFHPIFGIYKEFSKIKVVVRHEKSSRARDTPPV